MAAGCGMKCIKFLIFLFNFIFLVVGTALLIAGGFVLSKTGSLASHFNPMQGMAWAIIVIGALIFIPAFCGCCGAIRESRCMLITYAVIMGIMLLIEVILAIVGFVFAAKVRSQVETAMGTAIAAYPTEESAQALWSLVQTMFGCCGIHKADDWINKLANNSYSTPESCCMNNQLNFIPAGNNSKAGVDYKTCNTTDILKKTAEEQAKDINRTGCLDKVEAMVKPFIFIICGVALGVAFVELFGIVFAVCLAKAAAGSDEE